MQTDEAGQEGQPIVYANLSIEDEALLLRQCRLNKVDAVEAQIDQKRIPAKFRFSNGDTLVVTACKAGHKRLAKALLRRGAEMNGTDNAGNTALHWCYAKSHTFLADYLIQKGADETLTNKAGKTCMNWWDTADEAAAPRGGAHVMFNTPSTAILVGQPPPQKIELPAINKGPALKRDPRPPKAKMAPQGHKKSQAASPAAHRMPGIASPIVVSPKRLGGGRVDAPLQGAGPAEEEMGLRGRSSSTPAVEWLKEEVAAAGAEERSSSRQERKTRSAEEKGVQFDEDGEEVEVEEWGAERGDEPQEGEDGEYDERGSSFTRASTLSGSGADLLEAIELTNGLVNLFNFQSNDGDNIVQEITSPRSMQAMNLMGLILEQISPVDKDELLRLHKDPKVVEVRYKILDEMRMEKLKQAREERRRLANRGKGGSIAGAFKEYAGGGQTINLVNFLKMCEYQGLLRPQGTREEAGITKTKATSLFKKITGGGLGKVVSGQGVTLEQFLVLHKQLQKAMERTSSGSPAGKESHASSKESEELNRIEKMRERYRQSQENELRRVERHFSKVLDMRETQSQMQKVSHSKEQSRTKRLEERTFQIGNERIEHELKHVERLLEKEEERRKAEELLRKKQEDREREMQENLERKTKLREEQARLKAEAFKTKAELKDQANEQHGRKMLFMRQMMQAKQDKEDERAQAAVAEQLAANDERILLWTKDQMSKDHFNQVRVEYERSGEMKMPLGVTSLGVYDQLVNSERPTDLVDKNAEAKLLVRDSPIENSMKKGQYHWYKVCVEDALIIKFKADSLIGSVALFVGNGDCPRPTAQKHTWSKGGFEAITIFHLDRNYTLGYVYLAVQCVSPETRYRITCSYITDVENAEVVEETKKTQEDEALERAKLRIDSLLKNKLGARSADFIEKYNMLYSKDKLAVPPNP